MDKKISQAMTSGILEQYFCNVHTGVHDFYDYQLQPDQNLAANKPPSYQLRRLMTPINLITTLSGGTKSSSFAQSKLVQISDLKKGINQGKYLICKVSSSKTTKNGNMMDYRLSVEVTDQTKNKATMETSILIEDNIP